MKTSNFKNKNTTNNIFPEALPLMVDKKLKEYIKGYKNVPEKLVKPLKYCLLSGGKRFRPVLSLATAISLGYNPEFVLPAACAIEFIHSYSLIHDDLPAIDNDDIRRGKPSCHKKFGEDIAILTGDALFAESFNIFLKYQKGTPDAKFQALSEIASASGVSGMVAGQIVDIGSTDSKISKRMLEYIHINKTARLISASVVSSAILCGAKRHTVKQFKKYGLYIGLAFQITDDIIDIKSSSLISGKTRGKDQVQSKNTYPSIWGLDKSKIIAKENIDKAVRAIDKAKTNSGLLKNIAKYVLLRKA